ESRGAQQRASRRARLSHAARAMSGARDPRCAAAMPGTARPWGSALGADLAREAARGARQVTLVGAPLLPLGSFAQEADDDPWGFDDLDEAPPSVLELARDQAPDVLLFAAFAVFALIGFSRRSVPLKYATLVLS